MSAFNLPNKSWTTVGFRLLLIISLWQGPFPWFHRHTIGDEGLAVHLLRFHGGTITANDLGWHWHLSYPETDETGDPDGTKPLSQRIPRMLTSAGSCCSQVLLGADGLSGCFESCLPTSAILASIPGVGLPDTRGYLATFDPAHSAQQLLCRMSC